MSVSTPVVARVYELRPERVAPPSGRAAKPAQTHPALRLTRRGRLVLLVLSLLVAAAAMVAVAGQVFASGRQPTTTSITVQQDQTLWQIAGRIAPGADPRDTVARILAMNGLESSQVRPGDVLRVPASS